MGRKKLQRVLFYAKKDLARGTGQFEQLQPWKVLWICCCDTKLGLAWQAAAPFSLSSSLVSGIAGQACHLIFLFTVCTESLSPSA